MKKWIYVLLIIFIMVVTLILLAIVALFDTLTGSGISLSNEAVEKSPGDSVGKIDFLENKFQLVKSVLIFKPELSEGYIF
jgi:hypothetical protein